MRITNMLHFTENHRYCVYRDFSLSTLDYRMLTNIYQPMIGAFAVSLYNTLYGQLSAEKVGYSPLEQQRRLFLSLELEPGEKGRKYLIEMTSKLEAVGLLKTTRHYITEEQDYIFEYALSAPLSPNEFFKNQHLMLFLRDKVGKYLMLTLRNELLMDKPEQLKGSNSEDLSSYFYEIFELNTKVIDYELEKVFYESAAVKQDDAMLNTVEKSFHYSDIAMHFPKSSENRLFVENLRYDSDQLTYVNYLAKKYKLSLRDTCYLLDETGVFDEQGVIRTDFMEYRANEMYRQNKTHEDNRIRKMIQFAEEAVVDEGTEEPAEKPLEMKYYEEVPYPLLGKLNAEQYNYILRNEPYRRLLETVFSEGTIPDFVLSLISKVELNYKLHKSVVNILIHYILLDNKSWNSIEPIASDMIAKKIDTYEKGIDYIRAKMKMRRTMEKKSESMLKGTGRTRTAPAATASKRETAAKEQPRLTEEELKAIRNKIMKSDQNK